jgi:KDO2-lipid IV(A) lauroyltransferase
MRWAWLAALAGLLPWRALRLVGAVLGWLAGSLLRIRRRHVESAMRTAGVVGVRAQTRAMYRSLGTSAAEFLWMASRGEEALEHVTIDAASRVAWSESLARGRGAVVAASHTGSWDLAACAMAREVPLLVITKRLSLRSLDRFWQSTRARAGVALAPPLGAVRPARAMLARGGAVVMMIDQAPVSRGQAIRDEFLGRPAWIDRAPAALAARSRAPLVVAAARRDRGGEHVLHVLEVMVPPARPGRAWIDGATAAASRALDAFVRRYPSEWLWLHRRWKALDEAPLAGSAMLAEPCSNAPLSTRSSSAGTPFEAA